MRSHTESKYIFTIFWPVFIAIAMILTTETTSFAVVSTELIERQRQILTNALIEGTAISAPMGRFLLLRRGNCRCALKFTSFYISEPDTEYRHKYGEYEWYYSENKEDKVSAFSSGNGKVDAGNMKRFWRFISIPGSQIINCGNLELGWVQPAGISLLKKGFSSEGIGIEVAPTQWENIKEVDFTESSIVWYSYKDWHNEPKTELIPLQKLPPIAPKKPISK